MAESSNIVNPVVGEGTTNSVVQVNQSGGAGVQWVQGNPLSGGASVTEATTGGSGVVEPKSAFGAVVAQPSSQPATPSSSIDALSADRPSPLSHILSRFSGFLAEEDQNQEPPSNVPSKDFYMESAKKLSSFGKEGAKFQKKRVSGAIRNFSETPSGTSGGGQPRSVVQGAPKIFRSTKHEYF